MPAGPTYEPIATYTVPNTSTGYVYFNSIPQTYTDLVLITTARTTHPNTSNEMWIWFNNDATASYQLIRLVVTPGEQIAGRDFNQSSLRPGVFPGGNQNAIDYGMGYWNILNYTNNTTQKSLIGRTNDPRDWVAACVCTYSKTDPITSMTLSFTDGRYWLIGSTATLYGIKAA
jgi:hypothetical protein